MLSPARSGSINTTSSSLLPLLAVGVIWYCLSARGVATQLVWLALNVLDTLRALRAIRPNGRRIGVNARKKMMRDTLTCWIVYVVGRTAGPIFSTLLGWVPFYTPVKFVICVGFLFTRISTSSHIYAQFLIPALKPYETPIDLTLLLFQSILILVFHYSLELPVRLVWSSARGSWDGFSSLLVRSTAPAPRIIDLTGDNLPELLFPDKTSTLSTAKTTTDIDEHSVRNLASPGPTIPGSILLRHQTPKPARPALRGRRSIVFVSPPATPKISPPSSPDSVIVLQTLPSKAKDDLVTPRRGKHDTKEVSIGDGRDANILGVPQVAAVRRSPRRCIHRSEEVEATKINLEELDLMAGRASGSAQNVQGGTRRIVQSMKATAPYKNIDDEPEDPFVLPKSDTVDRREGKTQSNHTRRDNDAVSSLPSRNASSRVRPTVSKPEHSLVDDILFTQSNPQTLTSPTLTSTVSTESLHAMTGGAAPNPAPALQTTTTTTKITTARSKASSKPTTTRSRSGKTPIKKRSATSSIAAKASTRVLKASDGGAARDKPASTATVRSRGRAAAASASASSSKATSTAGSVPTRTSVRGGDKTLAVPTAAKTGKTTKQTTVKAAIKTTEDEGISEHGMDREVEDEVIVIEQDKKIGNKRRQIAVAQSSTLPISSTKDTKDTNEQGAANLALATGRPRATKRARKG
ncbi:hypothetical protein I317_01904 [Kwoniella heveanensis CBS 569]|nr:hypothetical protein I317_01904 [Kwoniella heveanensis CBS 569]